MPSPKTVKVGLVQTYCSEAPQDNLERTIKLIEQAAEQGAQIICLQELFTSLYFCQTEDHQFFQLAETIPGRSTDRLGEIAKKHNIVIIASLFEKRAAGLYHNTTAVIDADGSYLGKYRKMHIPDDPLYYEKFYFTPGDLGYKVFPTKYGRVGTLICWDQWYPEAARLTALQGADLLVYPTAIGWHPAEKEQYGTAQHQAWETIQRSHAIANGCYVVSVNRIGHEGAEDGGIQFWGQSFVADPSGTILKKGSTDQEEVMVVELNLEQLDVTRTHWPFLRDRRIDSYSPLTKRYIDESE